MSKNKTLSDLTKCNVFIAKEAIGDLKINEDEGWYVRNSIGGFFKVILTKISGTTFDFKVVNKDHEQDWSLERSDLPDSLFKRDSVSYSQMYWAANECIASNSKSDLKHTFELFFKGFDTGLKEWFLRFYESNKKNINLLNTRDVFSQLAIPMQ
jgi:hypothetical protein